MDRNDTPQKTLEEISLKCGIVKKEFQIFSRKPREITMGKIGRNHNRSSGQNSKQGRVAPKILTKK